jgi:hypothetical protein
VLVAAMERSEFRWSPRQRLHCRQIIGGMIGGFDSFHALSCHPARLKFSCLSEKAMQTVQGNDGIVTARKYSAVRSELRGCGKLAGKIVGIEF